MRVLEKYQIVEALILIVSITMGNWCWIFTTHSIHYYSIFSHFELVNVIEFDHGNGIGHQSNHDKFWLLKIS